MAETQVSRVVVGIVGGGFSGAAVAYHLATTIEPHAGVRIVVFEPRQILGGGLAYDTVEPVHRINVPAGKMTLLPDDPTHFARWIEATHATDDDCEAVSENGEIFPRRSAFGRYVAQTLQPLISSGAVEHRRATVKAIAPSGSGWHVSTGDDQSLTVDLLVLAVSHPPPSAPRALQGLSDHPKLISDPTRPDALAPVDADDRVLVVGNGLTAADVIAALKRRGHRGPITAISRRGLQSRGHAKQVQEPFGDFLGTQPRSATRLLRETRATIRQAAQAGISWHAVLDALRSQGGEIWRELPLSERQRIVRHLRPFWDVHRFRIAPQVENVLQQAQADGSLTVLAASVSRAEASDGTIKVSLKRRHQAQISEIEVDAVVVTTGPAHGGILHSQEFLAGLSRDGIIAPCPTGLGILCDNQAQAISRDGKVCDTLLIAGPLARGTFGELMGLPQVTNHAVFVADALRQRLPPSVARQDAVA